MRKIDFNERVSLEKDICRTQAAFYEMAAYDGCDIHKFSDMYLNSRFCLNRMETKYSSFQREDARTCLEFIYPEIGTPEQMPFNVKKDVIFNPDVAYWIGYTYYQLFCETGVHGKFLSVKVPFSQLLLNYPAHHTLDEEYSTDKLCSYYGLIKNDFYKSYSQYLDNGYCAII